LGYLIEQFIENTADLLAREELLAIKAVEGAVDINIL
jgi:hypothetical protein